MIDVDEAIRRATDARAGIPRHPRRRIDAQRIRALRGRFGLTQEDLAHAIGVTTSTLNRWENGRQRPSALAWRAVVRLATARGSEP